MERLLNDGHTVQIADNLSTGRIENLPGNLFGEKMMHGVDFRKCDLRDLNVAEEVCKGKDIIFHLAAEADISKSVNNHFLDLDGIIIMLNLLEGAMKAGVPQFVFTSSSAVYGDSSSIPTRESDPKQPISLYGVSKLACENLGFAFTQLSDIRFHAFRLANPIGVRSRKGVIWNFVHFLKENPKVLPILGDGKQLKGFFSVKDCIDGILTGYSKDQNQFNVFNLGHWDPTTVDRIADLVIEEMRLSGVEKRYAGGTRGWRGDIPVSVLSIEKMMNLGWEPKVPAEEAIREAIRWSIRNV